MTVEEFLNRLDRMSNQCRDAIHFTSIEPDMMYYSGMAKAFDVVYKDLSKVEFEDRPRGKWIKEKGCLLAYRCSDCKKLVYSREIESDEKFEDLSRLDSYKYCPRCGARMENNL